MQIFVEKVENPNQEFWIWKKKITNRQTEGIYPSTVSNVGSGISAAIYQKDEAGHVTQIAQLQLPDYEKLVEYYSAGKEINLNYTYIDDFAWLGDELPYEVESLPYTEREGFSARCALLNNHGEPAHFHIMQSKLKKGDMDFSYSGFFNLNLDLCNLSVEQGNLVFDFARFDHSNISVFSGNFFPLYKSGYRKNRYDADVAKPFSGFLMCKNQQHDYFIRSSSHYI